MVKESNYQGRHWAPPKPPWLSRHLTAAGAVTVIVALVAVSGLGVLSAPKSNATTQSVTDPADYPPAAQVITERPMGPLIPTQTPEPELEPEPTLGPVTLVVSNEEEIAALQDQIVELTKQLASALARAQAAEAALVTVQGQVTDLQAQLAALNDLVTTMQGLITTLEARIAALEGPPGQQPTPTPTATPTP